MIIVTGGAGFIGSNLIKNLNKKGFKKIIIVEDLTNGNKFRNLLDLEFEDIWDFENLITKIKKIKKIDVIFHQGAISTTTEWNGKKMLHHNYDFSKQILEIAINFNSQFIYASSASVYGVGNKFEEDKNNEKPINVYGYSKLLFDNYVRKLTQKKFTKNQIIGLRYFNVYGPGEEYKNDMSSVIFKLNAQIKDLGYLKLFKGYHGYKDGQQERDFVYIDDIININLWFMENKKISGIFNVGTGKTCTFNNVANEIIKSYNLKKNKSIKYIDMPSNLINSYQSFTKADITKLVKAGYKKKFIPINVGIEKYLKYLNY